MSRTCTVCANPNHEQMNLALVSREPMRTIAARYAVTASALQRHKTAHLPVVLAKAAAVADAVEGTNLLDRLKALNRETAAVLREARTDGSKDNGLALKAIARAEKQIELEGRLLGELKEGSTVNVLLTPEWTTVRAAILKALEGYPAARMAVAGALSNAGA
jgi:hypothetical protein